MGCEYPTVLFFADVIEVSLHAHVLLVRYDPEAELWAAGVEVHHVRVGLRLASVHLWKLDCPAQQCLSYCTLFVLAYHHLYAA